LDDSLICGFDDLKIRRLDDWLIGEQCWDAGMLECWDAGMLVLRDEWMIRMIG
jgi:hypothetical protein